MHYSPNLVELFFHLVPFGQLVQGGNPGAVAAYIDSISPLPEWSDLDNIIESIQFLDLDAMREAFDQMHPALYKGLMLSQENNIFRINSLLQAREDDFHLSKCSREFFKDKKTSVWGVPFFDFYQQKSFQDLLGFHTATGGFLMGFDHEYAKNSHLGVATAYSFSKVEWQAKKGKSDVNSFYGSLYFSWFREAFFLHSAIIGTFNSFQSHRKIHFADISRIAKNNHNGAEFFFHLESGTNFSFRKMVELRPFASFDVLYAKEHNFTETGANSLNLNVEGSDYTMLRSELGTHFSTCFTKKGSVIADLKLSWVQESRFKGKHYQAQLVNEPNHFVVSGMHPSRSLGAIGLYLSTFYAENRGMLSFKYDGEFGNKSCHNLMSIELMHSF